MRTATPKSRLITVSHMHRVTISVDHEGQGDSSPPHFGVKMTLFTLMQIAPTQILLYRYKKAFCGIQNTPKSVVGPDPAGGAHDALPGPLVGWGEDTPPHTQHYLASTHLRRSPCVVAEFQPDLRLCELRNSIVMLRNVAR